MRDLLYVGPESGFGAFASAAEALGVRLVPASMALAPAVLARYGAVLDGAVVAGGTAGALAALDRVAPGLPVALLDVSARAASPEAPGGWAEATLRQALEDLRVERLSEDEGDEAWVERGSGGWVAHAAYRLVGVAEPRDGADAERLAGEAGRWHLTLADVISRLPTGVTVRARYVGARGEARVGLIVTAEGPTEGAAGTALRQATVDLGPLLRAGVVGGGAYVLERADRAFGVPVRARVALTLRPPDGDDLAPLFGGSEMPVADPWTTRPDTALAEGERGGVGLPVVGPSGALGGLLRLLAGLGVPAVVDVAIRPAPLDEEERALAEELARQAVGARRSDGYGGVRALGHRAVQLAIESERAVSVAVCVAVDAAAVPAVLVVEAARALVGDPASVRAEPARGEVRGGLLVIAGAVPASGLAGRMGPDEAARSLRLPGPGVSVPGVATTHPARLQTPEALPEAGALVGHAPDGREVRISAAMLTTHALIAGATGTGKSTLASTLSAELAEAGHGLLVLDPHGTLAAQIRDRLPASRREDVVWIDGGERAHGHRVNLLDFDADDPASRDRVFDDLYSFFDAWYDMKDAGGPMFELHLRESLRLLLNDPTERHALPSLVRLFTDRAYRQLLVAVCACEETARFWRDAETRSDHAKISEVGPYVYSKINRLLGSHGVRQMVSSPRTTPEMDPAAWLRDGAVVLCSLPVGAMGAEGASVIGSVLLSRLVRAGFARLHSGEATRPFVAILDEAQRFAGGHESAVLMAEGRKVGLGLVALTQRLSSLSPSFREAALANAGLVAAMRVGVADAALLGPTLAPSFRAGDLLGLGRGEAAVRLQLPDGQPSRPFLLRTRPPA